MNRRQFLKKLLALPAMALLLKGSSPTEYGPSPMEKIWDNGLDFENEWWEQAGNRLVTDYSSGYSWPYSRMRTYEGYSFYPTTKTYDLSEADQELVRDYLAEPLPEIPPSVPYVTKELTWHGSNAIVEFPDSNEVTWYDEEQNQWRVAKIQGEI